MQYPTLAQLAEMTPEQRAQRLRGTPAKYLERMLGEAAALLAAISNEGLRKLDS
ncbi:hypothetical protein SEA_HERCULESXL_30 [Microbacterium phage HerculesXL]|nr:hypothetical protein SEA_HERCULESXL_30 [Microbacterium phage HerculesXL]